MYRKILDKLVEQEVKIKELKSENFALKSQLGINDRNKYKEVLDKIRKNNERIIDYGFDYDGFNNVEDLKKLIDMLVDYARKNNELLEEIE